jgi:hypothetical protein
MATETELLRVDRLHPILPYHKYTFPAEAGRVSASSTLQQKNSSRHDRRKTNGKEGEGCCKERKAVRVISYTEVNDGRRFNLFGELTMFDFYKYAFQMTLAAVIVSIRTAN